MKEGWTYKKLGEVCDTLNGLWKGKKPPFVNVGVIRNANFTKDFTLRFDNIEYLDVEERQYAKRKLRKGDLIIEKSGGSEKQPVGRAVLFDKEDGEFSFSNFTSVLRIKDKEQLLSEFLYKYLLFVYRRGDTKTMQKATTGIHNIEFERYLDIDIPCISLSEQRSIVSRLDAAFAKIDALKANAERQLAEARALFNRALTEEIAPKEGWEDGCLGDFLNFRRGFDLTHAEMKEGDVPVAGSNGIIGYHNVATNISPCITIGRSGSVGKLNIYDRCWAHNTTLFIDDFKGNDPYFLAYLVQSLGVGSYSGGSAVPTLNRNFIHPIKTSIPNKNVQHSIVTRLDALSANIRKLEELQRKILLECDALKQSLLKEIFI